MVHLRDFVQTARELVQVVRVVGRVGLGVVVVVASPSSSSPSSSRLAEVGAGGVGVSVQGVVLVGWGHCQSVATHGQGHACRRSRSARSEVRVVEVVFSVRVSRS